MNYLAHLFLSGKSTSILVGNFIGDSVRGNQFSTFDPAIQQGILLHRAIDRFTDTHPVVCRSKHRAEGVTGRYASVVIDVFYDHFLARDWAHHHPMPLPQYAQSVYTILGGWLGEFPDRSRRFYSYMVTHNVLESYSSIDGITIVLEQMAKRAKFESNMELAGNELVRDYRYYESEFREFLPELQHYNKQAIAALTEIK
jgi:acyl carrier protein phosphodiesterase